MVNLIQTNKFSKLHDNENFFFSKIDLINSTIQNIKSTNNKCVLIVGNGDLPFTDEINDRIPNNVVKIFTQNNLTTSERVESLPLGIGNSEPCHNDGHGEHWENVKEKVTKLTNIKNKIYDEFKIYCNFNNETFPTHRSLVKNISSELDYIVLNDNDLLYDDFINNILNTSCNLCPAGNGLDTHRLWETLYCNRIPITFKVNETRSYNWSGDKLIGLYENIYKKLPIIILDNVNDLKDKELLITKLNEVSDNWKNSYLLDYNYWENKIINSLL